MTGKTCPHLIVVPREEGTPTTGLAFFPDLAFFGERWAPRCATRAFLAAFGCSLLAGACAAAASTVNSVIVISPLAVITVTTSITPVGTDCKAILRTLRRSNGDAGGIPRCDGNFWQQMADAKKKLTRKQQEANRNIEDAARASNTPLRTLHGWLREPAFDAAYREAPDKPMDSQSRVYNKDRLRQRPLCSR
jgi:hypothetical protein